MRKYPQRLVIGLKSHGRGNEIDPGTGLTQDVYRCRSCWLWLGTSLSPRPRRVCGSVADAKNPPPPLLTIAVSTTPRSCIQRSSVLPMVRLGARNDPSVWHDHLHDEPWKYILLSYYCHTGGSERPHLGSEKIGIWTPACHIDSLLQGVQFVYFIYLSFDGGVEPEPLILSTCLAAELHP